MVCNLLIIQLSKLLGNYNHIGHRNYVRGIIQLSKLLGNYNGARAPLLL